MGTETSNQENNEENPEPTKKGKIISNNLKNNFIIEGPNKEENKIKFKYHIINSNKEYIEKIKLKDKRNHKIKGNENKEKYNAEKINYKRYENNNLFKYNKSNSSNYFNINDEEVIFNSEKIPKGNQTQFYNNIPRFLSFQRPIIKTLGNVTTYLNIQKSENNMVLEEIPKSEYYKYQGKEALLIGEGMDTGEYRFKGKRVAIILKEASEKYIKINQEEIMKEINIRKKRIKKEKKGKYEIIDRFYAMAPYDGEYIYKNSKMEQLQKQNEYDNQLLFKSNEKDLAFLKFESNHEINPQQTQSSKLPQLLSKNFNININTDIDNNNFLYKNLDINLEPKDNFSRLLFNKINNLRANPQSYIKTLEEAKNKIIVDQIGRFIYNDKIKIALTSGKKFFNEAIKFLQTVEPTDKLIFNPYLIVEMPKSEKEIKFKKDLELKAEKLMNEGIKIKSFWRDIIKDPEISFLMMIVDDIGEKSGMRRKDLLDTNMKYIGISSVEINESFVCYITLETK